MRLSSNYRERYGPVLRTTSPMWSSSISWMAVSNTRESSPTLALLRWSMDHVIKCRDQRLSQFVRGKDEMFDRTLSLGDRQLASGCPISVWISTSLTNSCTFKSSAFPWLTAYMSRRRNLKPPFPVPYTRKVPERAKNARLQRATWSQEANMSTKLDDDLDPVDAANELLEYMTFQRGGPTGTHKLLRKQIML